MNREQAGALVGVLLEAWPQNALTDASVALYVQQIEPLDADAGRRAVERLIGGGREFIPPVGVLRQAILREQGGGALKAPDEAWAEFRDNMIDPPPTELADGRKGYRLATWSHAIVRAAGEEVRGEVCRALEDPANGKYQMPELRSRYRSAYERLAGEWDATGTLPPDVDELAPLERTERGTIVLANGIGRVELAAVPDRPALPAGEPVGDEGRAAIAEARRAMDAMRERSREIAAPVPSQLEPIREGDELPPLPDEQADEIAAENAWQNR